MISLERIRTIDTIHNNFRGSRRVELNLDLLKKKRAGELEKGGSKKWNSGIWKESKTQLLAESKNKCAYCETPTAVVAYGDVEHFRPKSVYWWLAYSYENYLPSCTICNQKYKKNFFPLTDNKKKLKAPRVRKNNTDSYLTKKAPKVTVDPFDETAGRPWQEFTDELANEKALLLNPYVEDPEDYLAYEPNLQDNTVKVIPLRPELEPIIEACENNFGINRKELLDLRFEKYYYYMTIRLVVNDPGTSQNLKNLIQDAIEKMKLGESAYAGMIRYFEKQKFEDLPSDFN